MRTVNKVILIGNIAKDPLIRESQAGAKSALFVVATNRSFKDKSGELRNEAEFTNCIAWGGLAERCEQFLRKGKLVYIEGRLKSRTIEKEDGTRQYRTEVVALNLIFLNKRSDADALSTESTTSESQTHDAPDFDDDSF